MGWSGPGSRAIGALLCSVLILGAAACRRMRAPASGPAGSGIIERRGTYTLGRSGLTLDVGVKNALVEFAVRKGATEVFSGTDLQASDYSRWFLAWDDAHARLWFYSGDIGDYVWDVDPKGTATRRPTNELPKADLLTMPLPFYDAIGHTSLPWMPTREEIAAAGN